MGNGSALEVVLHDYALYKSTFTLLTYFTTVKKLQSNQMTTHCRVLPHSKFTALSLPIYSESFMMTALQFSMFSWYKRGYTTYTVTQVTEYLASCY